MELRLSSDGRHPQPATKAVMDRPDDRQPRPAHADDIALADAVMRGDVDAWRRFIETKSGAILAVLKRYLFDDDEIRTVYVDILARLRKHQLAQYEGRSALTTWLTLVARGAAADQLRHRLGRREDPVGLENLDERAREVFRLYHVEGLEYEDVRLRLRDSGRLAPGESLAEILTDIESNLTDRTLRRIAWDLHASSVGATSGRLMEYTQAMRDEYASRRMEMTPEAELIAREAASGAARLRELVEALPEEERRVLELRFDEGWTADEVAEELGLESRRRVYTVADRAVARLRRWLDGKTDRE